MALTWPALTCARRSPCLGNGDMTPATRETLETYAYRMDQRYAEVLRWYRSLSKTQQGRFLVESRQVEREFLAWQERRLSHWTRRLGRWLGRMLARVAQVGR